MKIINEEGLIDSEVSDILYELGNVGLGSASITLGKLMGVRMHIGIPNIVTVDEIEAKKLINRDGCTVITMEFQKNLKGLLVVVINDNFIGKIISKMAGAEENLDEIESKSVLQEFANIIGAAYLKAISRYTNLRIYVKPAVINGVSQEKTLEFSKAICVDTGYSASLENGDVIEDVGRVIILPDEESVGKLIEPLCD